MEGLEVRDRWEHKAQGAHRAALKYAARKLHLAANRLRSDAWDARQRGDDAAADAKLRDSWDAERAAGALVDMAQDLRLEAETWA